jgi:hypothetical protein
MVAAKSDITKDDQFIVRLVENKVSQNVQLMNELVVRLENGYPTTEREARQFDERQEANLRVLAKELLGKDIVLGKKKDENRQGRNDPYVQASNYLFLLVFCGCIIQTLPNS